MRLSRANFTLIAICLGRVYVNKDSATLYEDVFKMFFWRVQTVTKRKIKWRHIHNEKGIEAVIVDMCPKQASGIVSLPPR